MTEIDSASALSGTAVPVWRRLLQKRAAHTGSPRAVLLNGSSNANTREHEELSSKRRSKIGKRHWYARIILAELLVYRPPNRRPPVNRRPCLYEILIYLMDPLVPRPPLALSSQVAPNRTRKSIRGSPIEEHDDFKIKKLKTSNRFTTSLLRPRQDCKERQTSR